MKIETSVTYTSRDVKMLTGYTGIEFIVDYPKFVPISPQVYNLVLLLHRANNYLKLS